MKFINRLFIVSISLLVLVGIDGYTKHLAVVYLMDESPIFCFLGCIEFVYAENQGGMLGVGEQLPEFVRFIIFEVAVGIVLIFLFLYTILKVKVGSVKMISYILIISGGLGNLIDRMINDGKVIDFILIRLGELQTGIFNAADFFVTAGIFILLFESIFHKKETHETKHSSE